MMTTCKAYKDSARICKKCNQEKERRGEGGGGAYMKCQLLRWHVDVDNTLDQARVSWWRQADLGATLPSNSLQVSQGPHTGQTPERISCIPGCHGCRPPHHVHLLS